MTNNQRELLAAAAITMVLVPFMILAACMEMAAGQRQKELEQVIAVDEPDQLRLVDYQVCTSVRNGELESRKVKADPYGRKKDVA
jgi:hypothetical protein